MVKSLVEKAAAFFSFYILNKTKNTVENAAAIYKTLPSVMKRGRIFYRLFLTRFA